MTNDEFIAKLYLKNKYFREGLFTVESKFFSLDRKIKVKGGLAEYMVRPFIILKGGKPTLHSVIDKDLYFKNKSIEKHGLRYKYDRVNYINSYSKVIIHCRIHGDFMQNPNEHLKGQGCPICGKKSSCRKRKRTTGGWSLKDWIKLSERSSNFESYKVYIIKCWNKVEEFYKIGRTFNEISKRFSNITSMPYKYKVVKIIEGTAEEVYNLEIHFKKHHNINKYTPLLHFKGMYESVKSIDWEEINKY